jgi:hypothetical protein
MRNGGSHRRHHGAHPPVRKTASYMPVRTYVSGKPSFSKSTSSADDDLESRGERIPGMAGLLLGPVVDYRRHDRVRNSASD